MLLDISKTVVTENNEIESGDEGILEAHCGSIILKLLETSSSSKNETFE